MSNLYIGAPVQLEKRLSADIAAAKLKDSLYAVIVVVENNLTGVYLRRVLAGHIGSHCRVRFVTLRDLAAELALQAEPDQPQEPPPYFVEHWLAVLAARRAAGGYFDPVAGFPGFSAALQQTFTELLDAGVEQLPRSLRFEPERLAELQRLYDYYRGSLNMFAHSAKAYDPALRAVRPREPFHLMIYGCYCLTPRQWELTRALAGAENVPVSVYWQKQALRLAPVQVLLERYLGSGLTLKRLDTGRGGGNLGRLQQRLFNPRTAPAHSTAVEDSTLQFICASDEVQEVDYITAEILDLARQGKRFAGIAVAVYDPAYTVLLKERFAAAGIPYYTAGGRTLAQTRTARGLLLFLDLVGGDYPRFQVIDFVAYAPLDFERVLGASVPVNPAFWDTLSREAGVVKKKGQWFRALEQYGQLMRDRLAKGSRGEISRNAELPDCLEALKQLRRFLERLFEAAGRFPVRGDWAGFTGACRSFLEDFFYPGEEREAILDLLHHLRGLDRLGEQTGLDEAKQLLARALQGSVIPGGRFQQDGVNIIPAGALAGIRFDTVFIPGLVEGTVPAPWQPDPLLPENERLAFEGALPLRSRKLLFDALGFSLLLNCASQRAVLTWPRTAVAGGREQAPSVYLIRAGEALLRRRMGLHELNCLPGYARLEASPFPPPRETAASVLAFDRRSCDQLAPGRRGGRYLKSLSAWMARLLDFDRSASLARMTRYQGVFTPEGPAALLSREMLSDRPLAVTALELYARCPYLFFLSRLLGLEPVEEAGGKTALSPPQRGLLVHRILEIFYRRAAEEKVLPPARSPRRCRELLAQICRKEFETTAGSSSLQPLFWKTEQRVLTESMQAFLEWEISRADNFEPRDLELSFGNDAENDPLEVALPGGAALKLRGRIDRVDRCGERVRVIDYKTGSNVSADDSLEGGTALQLPVYLLAVRKLLGLGGLEEAEALACYLSPAGVKTATYSGRDWPEKEEQLRETLQVLYTGLADGRYFPYPGKQGEHCRSCRFRTLCGPGIKQLFARKSKDPALQPFLKLRGQAPRFI